MNEWKDRVIWGDAFEVMPLIPDEIVDTVFWDPPYYLQLPARTKGIRRWKVNTEVSGVYDDWDRFESFREYDVFVSRSLAHFKRLMKPDGTIWVMGSYHNIHRIGRLMQDMGFWILNDVIWHKANPMPNWLGVRFTNAVEILIWAVKDKHAKGYYFDRAKAKEYAGNGTGSCMWKLPVCNGHERLRDNDGSKLHSTQKPEALLERVISISTPPQGLILDPMAGTGTTAAVAKKLQRHFIVIEKEVKYVEAIHKRLGL